MKSPAIGGGAYLGGAVAATKNRDKSISLFRPLSARESPINEGGRSVVPWACPQCGQQKE